MRKGQKVMPWKWPLPGGYRPCRMPRRGNEEGQGQACGWLPPLLGGGYCRTCAALPEAAEGAVSVGRGKAWAWAWW